MSPGPGLRREERPARQGGQQPADSASGIKDASPERDLQVSTFPPCSRNNGRHDCLRPSAPGGPDRPAWLATSACLLRRHEAAPFGSPSGAGRRARAEPRNVWPRRGSVFGWYGQVLGIGGDRKRQERIMTRRLAWIAVLCLLVLAGCCPPGHVCLDRDEVETKINGQKQ